MHLDEFSPAPPGGSAQHASYSAAEVFQISCDVVGIVAEAQASGDVVGDQSGGVGCEEGEEFAYFVAQSSSDGFGITLYVERYWAEDIQVDRLGLLWFLGFY
ncbi:hypothetical protein, partial [Streptomyces coffeae]|uniref:hypothetical protein n=1 Tax=Streptomyces coffeae TaxID=621382 RepID=UPI001F289180